MKAITNNQLAQALRKVIDGSKAEVESMKRQAIQIHEAIDLREANILVLEEQLWRVESVGTR